MKTLLIDFMGFRVIRFLPQRTTANIEYIVLHMARKRITCLRGIDCADLGLKHDACACVAQAATAVAVRQAGPETARSIISRCCKAVRTSHDAGLQVSFEGCASWECDCA